MGVQVDRFHICKDLLPAVADGGETRIGVEELPRLLVSGLHFHSLTVSVCNITCNQLKQMHTHTKPFSRGVKRRGC